MDTKGETGMGKRVAVYRHQLFQRSETFITSQATSMKQYEPVFVGRTAEPGWPESWRVVTLPDTRSVRWGHALLNRFGLLFSQLSEESISIVHAHFGVEGCYAMDLARKLDVPLVTTFHGFDASLSTSALVLSARPSWVRYALLRNRLAERGNLFLCVSERLRERVIKQGFPEERTQVHYIGVDVGRFAPAPVAPQRKEILFVGRLVQKKAPQVLVRAFARISEHEPDAFLTIIGDGPLRPLLARQIAEERLADRIQLLGPQPHHIVAERMKGAYLFCLPSVTTPSGETEGLPIVILEAMASMVPVVATRHGGIPEAISSDDYGILVPERDTSRLSSALLSLLRDENHRSEISINARERVVRDFNLHKQTQILEQMYVGQV